MAINPERLQQIEELYHRVGARPPAEWETFLTDACGSDQDLRREVMALLEQTPGAGPMERPVLEVAAGLLADSPGAQWTAGTQVGPYEIMSRIGEGGMGEVYKARDTRLGRQVAIKVVREEFSGRFQREAEAISALSHWNICTLFDVGPNYLVMELVEGESLSSRLQKGRLGMELVLRYGAQIGDALREAHSKGIIHRDLKPANIMITHDGIKVLDFGLAKFADRDPAGSQANTATASQTIVGTPAYMAPEQALGQPLDARADLFSLGVVMYEMATGKRPFRGDTYMATIDAILHKAPAPPSQSNPSISDGLEQIIEKALEKDRDMRYQTASGILADLKRLLRDTDRDSDSRSPPAAKPPVAAPSQRRRYVLAAVILAAALAGGLLRWAPGTLWNRAASPAPLRRLTSDTGLTTDSAISPDGKLVAYASDRAGHDNLDIWVQQVDGGSPLRLTSDPGNESEPSFSPDGNQIVFRSELDGGGIYTIPALGGEPRLIAKGGYNPRFSPDGTRIAYVTGRGGPGGVAVGELFVVPAAGGKPQRLVPGTTGSAYPVWSPDGKWILFAQGVYRIEDWAIVSAVSVQVSSPIVLPLSELKKAGLADLTPCEWDEKNRILFSAKSGDSSHVFELTLSPPNLVSKGWRLGSSPVRITSGTDQDEMPSLAAAVGGGRRLAFTSLMRSENLWSLALDTNQPRTGGKIQRLTEATGAFHVFPDISSDGTKVVYISHTAYNDTIWLLDLKTGKRLELPAPVSSKLKTHIYADGSRVFYDGGNGINVMPSSGGPPEKVCRGGGWTWDWSLEYKRILYFAKRANSVVVGMLNLDTCQDSVLLERPGSDLYDVRWSPDSRWLAFNSTKGVHRQTYVAPFTGDQGPDERAWIPITDGSTWEDKLRWSPDGNWLYSLSDRDGFPCIWAHRLDPRSKKPAGPPVAVFHSHGARLALRNANPTALEVSIARDKIVFNQGEITGNIWLTTLPEN